MNEVEKQLAMLVSKDKVSENQEEGEEIEEEKEGENLWGNVTSFSSLRKKKMKNEITDRISLKVIISSGGEEKEERKRKKKEKKERKMKSFPEKFNDFFIHPFNLIHNEIH